MSILDYSNQDRNFYTKCNKDIIVKIHNEITGLLLVAADA